MYLSVHFLLSVMTPGEDLLIVVEEYFSMCHAHTHSYTFEYIIWMDSLGKEEYSLS